MLPGRKRRRGEESKKREKAFAHINGGLSVAEEEESRRINSKMAKDPEVERIAKKLDKMVHKKNTVSSVCHPN